MFLGASQHPEDRTYQTTIVPTCMQVLAKLALKHEDKSADKAEFYYLIVQDYYAYLETFFQTQIVPKQTPLKPACEKGCSYCCNTAVSLSAPEREALPRFLQENYSPGQIKNLKRKSAKIWKLANQHEYYVSANQPCPFLKKGCCSIYEFRPVLCRGYNSVVVSSCKAAQAGIKNIPHEEHQFIYYQLAQVALIRFYDQREKTNYLEREREIKQNNPDQTAPEFVLTQVLSTIEV